MVCETAFLLVSMAQMGLDRNGLVLLLLESEAHGPKGDHMGFGGLAQTVRLASLRDAILAMPHLGCRAPGHRCSRYWIMHIESCWSCSMLSSSLLLSVSNTC